MPYCSGAEARGAGGGDSDNLYKQTQMQISFGVILLAIVNGSHGIGVA